MERRLAAGTIERAAKNLAVDGDDALADFGKCHHEPLETGTELIRIQVAGLLHMILGKLCQEAREKCIIPSGPFKFSFH
jgi:hypothetical protein